MKNRYIKKKGFTLAEVLITLSIIGVIAAILFPSILANYNERTLKAKRQALFGRMSQAMGEMTDTFRNYADVTCTDATDVNTCTDVGSAAKFVNEGLSKVYKIAAVCDNDSLAACDIPEKITREDGSTFNLKENGKTMLSFNTEITKNNISFPYDTNSVGVMTKNGESILLWYNPNCQGKSTATYQYIYVENMYCVNMVFDLNGAKKKPNKIGEDIGFMSVFYNDMPYVVAPKPYNWKAVPDNNTTTNATGEEVILSRHNMNQAQAQAACAALGDNIGLPSYEEGMSMLLNRELWTPKEDHPGKTGVTGGAYGWTSTKGSPNEAWMIWYAAQTTHYIGLITYLRDVNSGAEGGARCVYKD